MSRIIFRNYRQADKKMLIDMIKELFTEDPTPQGMTEKKIERTIKALGKKNEKGKIIIFEVGKEVIGYSILINFWSNEYGGNILYIDELFVRKEWRGKGIATGFINYLVKKRRNNTVSLFLEVTPQNKNAEKLYSRLGFEVHKNKRMTKSL